MLKIKINNVTVFVKSQISILEICQMIGITIPRFCYHEKLSIAGNCRMCLVEVENLPKPVVSCSMPVMNDMKIHTNTPLVKKARENILELLLLNHPLDCPICDQGGECDLQDQALVYGSDNSRFYEYKRSVSDKNLGPIIKTIMTRCIHCTRCVRFAQEIAGVEDLGTLLRGTDTEIGTYVSKIFKSEISGNVIDLCPVGALTSKPYAFLARSWELKTFESIDCSDSLGSNIKIYVKNNKIVRITPKQIDIINNNWISDKTRFLFDSTFSNNRLIKNPSLVLQQDLSQSGFMLTLKWLNVFKEITRTAYVLNHFYNFSNKKGKMLIVVGGNVDLETLLMLDKLKKQFKFIDIKKETSSYLLSDFSTDFLTKIDNNYLSKSTFCCLIGVNTRYESSALNLRLRKRYLVGNFSLVQIGPFKNLTFLSDVIGLNIKNVLSLIAGTSRICQQLILSKNPIVIIGPSIFQNKNFEKVIPFLKFLNLNLNTQLCLHYLHNSSNDSSFNFLNQFKNVSINDYNNYNLFYFIENTHKAEHFETYNNLCSSGFYNFDNNIKNKVSLIINQNSNPNFLLNTKCFGSKKNKKINYFLPTTTIFEKKKHFFNTYGFLQKTEKALSSLKKIKDSSLIIQILKNHLQNYNFFNISKSNVVLKSNTFDLNHYIPFYSLNKFQQRITFNKCLSDFISKTNKVYNSRLVLKIDNFYVGGNDILSFHSKIMKKCSSVYKNNINNFNQ